MDNIIFAIIAVALFVASVWAELNHTQESRIKEMQKCFLLPSGEERDKCINDTAKTWGAESYRSFMDCYYNKGKCQNC